jgi:hypothetical protein
MKIRSTIGVLLLLAFGMVALAQPPNFSGTWVPVDSATTAPPLPPSVPGGPPPPPPPPRTLSLGISQSATQLTLDRRMEIDGREVDDRVLYRLDGAETVHTTGVMTFRTKAAWEGDTLVLSSTVSHEGNAIGDLRETYRLIDGTLVVESTRKSAAGTFTGRTVHARRP